MSSGRGVTNYSTDKPSHAFSTRTTEFDDELIRHKIVTVEQVMLAKGASPAEALRLADETKNRQTKTQKNHVSNDSDRAITGTMEKAVDDNGDDDNDDDDDSFLDDDDDELFMERYRKERLAQLQAEATTMQSSSSATTRIEHIFRRDWKSKVNEASMDHWVVVCMTESNNGGSSRYHDRVVQELHHFARECDPDNSTSTAASPVSLLTIDYTDAIPNWPAERVPTMFAYRNGAKQKEWIAPKRGEFPSREFLGGLFRQWGIS